MAPIYGVWHDNIVRFMPCGMWHALCVLNLYQACFGDGTSSWTTLMFRFRRRRRGNGNCSFHNIYVTCPYKPRHNVGFLLHFLVCIAGVYSARGGLKALTMWARARRTVFGLAGRVGDKQPQTTWWLGHRHSVWWVVMVAWQTWGINNMPEQQRLLMEGAVTFWFMGHSLTCVCGHQIIVVVTVWPCGGVVGHHRHAHVWCVCEHQWFYSNKQTCAFHAMFWNTLQTGPKLFCDTVPQAGHCVVSMGTYWCLKLRAIPKLWHYHAMRSNKARLPFYSCDGGSAPKQPVFSNVIIQPFGGVWAPNLNKLSCVAQAFPALAPSSFPKTTYNKAFLHDQLATYGNLEGITGDGISDIPAKRGWLVFFHWTRWHSNNI